MVYPREFIVFRRVYRNDVLGSLFILAVRVSLIGSREWCGLFPLSSVVLRWSSYQRDKQAIEMWCPFVKSSNLENMSEYQKVQYSISRV